MQLRDIEEFARFLVSHDAGIDWLALLRRYRWHGTDWVCGVRTRLQFRDRLQELTQGRQPRSAPPGDWPRLVDDLVVDWGGGPPVRVADLRLIWRSVLLLRDEPGWEVDGLHFGNVEVAASRVYQAAAPKRWIAFDGRVAHALQGLVAKRFPDPTAVPPDLRAATPTEFAKGFFTASALSTTIAAVLRHEHGIQPGAVQGPDGKLGDPRWQPFHIEMALHVLGADLEGGLPC